MGSGSKLENKKWENKNLALNGENFNTIKLGLILAGQNFKPISKKIPKHSRKYPARHLTAVTGNKFKMSF